MALHCNLGGGLLSAAPYGPPFPFLGPWDKMCIPAPNRQSCEAYPTLLTKSTQWLLTTQHLAVQKAKYCQTSREMRHCSGDTIVGVHLAPAWTERPILEAT